MDTISLMFGGNTVTLTPDSSGRYNLNTIHEVVGKKVGDKPSNFIRLNTTKLLVSQLQKTESHEVVKTTRGRTNGGTWAERKVVFAYASWISAQFHEIVLEAFGEAVDGNGDGAVAVARTAARSDGVAARKTFASQLGRHGATRGDYRNMSDIINLTVLGKASSTLKLELGISRSGSLRDKLPEVDLLRLAVAESLAAVTLSLNTDKRHGTMRSAVYEASEKFKSLGI